jgi:hypothetical protein
LSSGCCSIAICVTPAKARAFLREILKPPEIGDRIDRQHGRGIVALLLDELADFRRRPGASSAMGGMTGFTARPARLFGGFGA